MSLPDVGLGLRVRGTCVLFRACRLTSHLLTRLHTLVPFEEDERDPTVWFLDHNYIESMNDMFKKVNAREKLIGWYHTGPKLRGSDLEINELFKRYTPNPLLVIVDVQPKEVGVPTDAYFAVEEIKDVRMPSLSGFRQLLTLSHRTAPQHPRHLYIHHPQSRRKKRKRLASSTYYVISATWRSEHSPPASHPNSSRYRVYTSACGISRHT